MFLHQNKKEGSKIPLMELIGKIAEEAEVDGSNHIEIYYTGHGQKDSGNWVMEMPDELYQEGAIDYTCSLNDVVQQLNTKGYTKKLNITTDCCYSGQWCHSAKELVDAEGAQFESF